MEESLKKLDAAIAYIKMAMRLANSAYDAAMNCDMPRAERLITMARMTIKQCQDVMNTIPADHLKFFMTDDTILRVAGDIEDDLAYIEKKLLKCKKRIAGLFSGKPSGSFERTTEDVNGIYEIRFDFAIQEELECSEVCVVSMYYLEEVNTGKIVSPFTDGCLQEYAAGGTLFGRPGNADEVDGHVIDSAHWKYKPDFKGKERKQYPCLPTSKHKDKNVSASDMPTFVKNGYIAYFETCVICFLNGSYKILGCMRWNTGGSQSNGEIEKSKSGAIDHWPPSPMFKRALDQWLKNNK